MKLETAHAWSNIRKAEKLSPPTIKVMLIQPLL